MKKIKLLTFLGALLCSFFIFNFNHKASADNTKKIYEVINLDYDISLTEGNFRVSTINETADYIEIIFVVKDDIFIDYMYSDDIYNNVFLQLDYFESGYNQYFNYRLYDYEIRNGNELHATVNILKSHFNYYIEEIVQTDEETFYNNFSNILRYDLYQYFKLYVCIGEGLYTYMKFTDYNVTANLKETSTYTTVYDVYIYINVPYQLENDISIRFKHNIGTANLRTPLHRNYNSYTIHDFRYSMDYYRWRIHLDIALLNTLLINYNNDIDYILEELIEIYIGVTSGIEYIHGYNAGYLDGINAGEQLGWHDGYNAGYLQGKDDGYIDGVDDGYSQGYEAGLQASQSEAYEKGYQDGANKSFIGTMDKWLVPAIIVVMLLGGYFAIARKKRDGDI